ncbi:MAG: Holliday junction branch migration protein RuvA [Bacteroidales bacterium]|nr:Holliday junction branch migration protein RuvA [Bacteroidales bacterium]MDY2878013.1 Holliday junction branch migration protein RuvA [Candidatus Cryptobacteroides sp.]
MIDFVTGKLCEISPTRVVVDNNGIGYAMEISLQTYDLLKEKKEAVVYVLSQVNQREGTSIDYGFANKEERELFKLITSVSGIGASSARMILSSLSAGELREAILSENVNTLKSIKGIGLKSAQRMILELKDKIVKGEGASNDLLFASQNNEILEEASSALMMLGFNKANIQKAIQNIIKANPNASVEQIIKSALKML